MSTVSPFFTVLKHLSAAFSPHSLGMGEDVCVCVFPCPKRSLPRDYPSFCREPLELLTQQLPAEKLCICIDCACLYLCVFLRVSLLFPPQYKVSYGMLYLSLPLILSHPFISFIILHTHERLVFILHFTL